MGRARARGRRPRSPARVETSASAARPRRDSASPRSRSRSPRPSPWGCSTSRRRPASGRADVRVRHLLAHTSGYDCECRATSHASATATTRSPPASPSCPSVRRLVGAGRSGRTRTPATGWPGFLARRAAGSTYEEALPSACSRPRARGDARSASPTSPAPARTRRAGRTPGRAARRAASSRPSPTCCASAAAARGSRRSARMRVVHGKPTAGVYGLGLFGERVGGIEVWGHPGSYGGFQSSLLLVPTATRSSSASRTEPRRQGAARGRGRVLRGVIGARRRRRRPSSCPPRRSTRFAGTYANSDADAEVAPAATGSSSRSTTRSCAARPIGSGTFEIVGGDARPASASTSRVDGFGALRQPARRARPVIAAVAAGHPATAEAGAEILADGGNAADAAVAACLASCVAETVMTGLLGGGHAIYFDAATRHRAQPRLLRRGPVGRRRADGAPPGPVRRGARRTTRSARRRARCPGSRPGSTRSGARTGGCRGAARRAGAAARARRRRDAAGACGVPRDARAGDDDARRRRDLRARRTLLEDGRPARASRGSSRRSSSCATRAPRRSTTGSIAARAARARRRARGVADAAPTSRAYEAIWSEPVEVAVRGQARAHARRALAASRRRSRASTRPAAPRRCSPRSRRAAGGGHTTNLTVVDADGNACVLTTSLGLGSGDWLPGLDLHLNSMLGEADLVRGRSRRASGWRA